MKLKSFLLFALLTGTAGSAIGADNETSKASFFQFSLCPRFGTNGRFESEYTNHLSVNLTAGISGGEQGLAVAGISHIIGGQATGVQIAGVSNHVRTTGAGLQIAGIVNTVRSRFQGVQIAGVGNHAGDVNGIQFAPIYNTARRVKGAQIGLVNVAEHSDWTIGLVNIVKDGEMSLSLGYNTAGSAMLTFRSGGRYTYGILGVGYSHLTPTSPIALDAGIGIRIPCCPWFGIDNEFKASTLGTSSKESANIFGYTLLPTFHIGKHFGLSIGASLDYLHAPSSDYSSHPATVLWQQASSTGRIQQLAINLQASVRYVF